MRSINNSLLLISGPRVSIVTPTVYTWLAVPRYPARVLTPSHTLKSAQTKGSVVVFWFAAQHDTAQRPLRGAQTVFRSDMPFQINSLIRITRSDTCTATGTESGGHCPTLFSISRTSALAPCIFINSQSN